MSVADQTTSGHDSSRSISGLGDVHGFRSPSVFAGAAASRRKSKSTVDNNGESIAGRKLQKQQQLRQLHQRPLASAPATVISVVPNASNCDGAASAASRQTMARRARRDKHASRREKKATKTLAIVLGE
jgi:hypothetical protein